MRTKPPKEILPVQMDEQSMELSRSTIGPLVMMSGYLTKKTHSRNRWLHRWYQLLDNGMLQYYQTDKKVKLLGEIDIGRTCYDVRQGARNCLGVSFPRVAPRVCCFCFAVLKRTYYMYAPTAMEAKKWFESIHNASNVLNRRVVAGVKRRKAPELPGSDRRPSLPLNYRISVTPWDMKKKRSTSLQDVHRIRVRMDSDPTSPPPSGPRALTRASRVYSVPDSLDRMAGTTSPIFSPDEMTASALSLDTCTTPDPTQPIMPLNKTSSPIVAVAGGTFGSLSHLECVSSPSRESARHRARSVGCNSPEPEFSLRRRPKSLPGIFKESKKELSPRPASAAVYVKSLSTPERPQPQPRLRLSPNSPQPKPRSRPTSQTSPQPHPRHQPQASPQPHPRQMPQTRPQPQAKSPQPLPRTSPHTSPQHQVKTEVEKARSPRPSSPPQMNSKPSPAKNRARYLAGAVQIMPVNGAMLKARHKTLSKSNEALFDGSTQEESGSSVQEKTVPTTTSQDTATTPTDTSSRPVPKPRKQTREEDPTEPVVPKRSSKVTFSDQPNILNTTSPTDSDSSVSFTTGVVVSSLQNETATEDLPPPRPRKDSGPPNFVPPPPPQEQDAKVEANILSS